MGSGKLKAFITLITWLMLMNLLASNLSCSRLSYEALRRLPDAMPLPVMGPIPDPPLSNKLAFISDYGDLGSELYTMDADGSNIVRVSNSTGNEIGPVWSPDGTKIAFISSYRYRTTYIRDIYIMNADGSNQIQLTDNTTSSSPSDLSFSPDGTKIAFVDRIDFREYSICVMNVDGSNRITLTDASRNFCWSPDGSMIAFVGGDSENEEIYTVAPDGSDLKNITNDPASDAGMSFSPDGNKIMFTSDRGIDNELADIFVMNLDGSDVTRLTNTTLNETRARLSPDGTKIIYERMEWEGSSRIISTFEMFIMDADGSNQRQLTDFDVYDQYSDGLFWSPDGSKIVYELNNDIWVMNADGSNTLQLTEYGAIGQFDWSSDGSKIAFSSAHDSLEEELFTVESDGTRLIRVTGNMADYGYYYDYSPDGSTFAFMGVDGIYTVNIDGTGLKELIVREEYDNHYPTWSPDGSKIAFVSNRDAVTAHHRGPNDEIYIMDADGSNVMRLTHNEEGMIKSLQWSPDGSKLLYFWDETGDEMLPYVNTTCIINADGSNYEFADKMYDMRWSHDGSRILFTKEDEWYSMKPNSSGVTELNWPEDSVLSPDGTRIAYHNNEGIYVARANGTAAIKVADAGNYNPIWSTDGTKIAYQSTRDGRDSSREIYVVNADGSDERQVTDSEAHIFYRQITWLP